MRVTIKRTGKNGTQRIFETEQTHFVFDTSIGGGTFAVPTVPADSRHRAICLSTFTPYFGTLEISCE